MEKLATLALSLVFLPLITTKVSAQSNFITSNNGTWVSDSTVVTIRKSEGFLKYSFIKDVILINLMIQTDGTISGNIGTATFTDAKLSRNPGNPNVTGVDYNISLGNLPKLFELDTETNKRLALWCYPQTHPDTLKGELRLESSFDKFPMASIVLHKK
jgi:hypothetical protein